MAAPIYVVVCSDDMPLKQREPGRPQNPIVMETNVNGATMEEAGHRADHMERQGYGACRIARLVFEDHPAFSEGQA